MGCSESREQDMNEYESLIIRCEEELGLSSIECDRIDAVFKRYSLSCKMSSSQFLTAFRELKLKSEYGPLDHPVTKFYNSFKHGSYFVQRKLSALGILLGKGSDKEKARVLFKIYDDSKDGNLNLEEVRNMLDDLTDISLVMIPNFALNSVTEEILRQDLNKFNRRLHNIQYTIKNFFEIIIMKKQDDQIQDNEINHLQVTHKVEQEKGKRARKREAKNRRVTQFADVIVSLDEFIEKFSKKNMTNLCSAAKLRRLAIAFHSQTVAPRDLVKDFILESNKNRL